MSSLHTYSNTLEELETAVKFYFVQWLSIFVIGAVVVMLRTASLPFWEQASLIATILLFGIFVSRWAASKGRGISAGMIYPDMLNITYRFSLISFLLMFGGLMVSYIVLKYIPIDDALSGTFLCIPMVACLIGIYKSRAIVEKKPEEEVALY